MIIIVQSQDSTIFSTTSLLLSNVVSNTQHFLIHGTSDTFTINIFYVNNYRLIVSNVTCIFIWLLLLINTTHTKNRTVKTMQRHVSFRCGSGLYGCGLVIFTNYIGVLVAFVAICEGLFLLRWAKYIRRGVSYAYYLFLSLGISYRIR